MSRDVSARPVLASLPLYASDAELARVLLGKRASSWKSIAPILERKGLTGTKSGLIPVKFTARKP